MNKKWAVAIGGVVIIALALFGVSQLWPPEMQTKPKIDPNGIAKPAPAPEVGAIPKIAPMPTPVPVSLGTATEFLYVGAQAKQTGVKEGAIQPHRAAVLRGQVLTRDGEPMAGVIITIDKCPEFGSTTTDAKGVFDLAVNGGGHLCVHYRKESFLPLCRQLTVPWHDYAWLPDVVLIPVDASVTAIDLTAKVPIQVTRSSVVKDKDGGRQSTLLIPGATKAIMILPDGSEKSLTTLSMRATEYTVGPKGPAGMPAALPTNSAYTYAVELSVDEATAAGAKDVRFSKPLAHYVENFLNFPTGTTVPVGYYDRNKTAWVPSKSGRIVKLLAFEDGLAALDLDGKDKSADAKALAKLGVTDDERRQLASLYKPGQSLWRVPITHFSTWDFNWPWGPPKDATAPGQPDPKAGDPTSDPCFQGGSIIDVHNQVLGEAISLAGSVHRLHYQSDRVPGHKAAHSLKIFLSGDKVPTSLKRIELEIQVAGRRFTEENLPAKPNQSYGFIWDGKDAYGRVLQGGQPASIRIGYVYDGVYEKTDAFGYSGNGVPITGSATRQEVSIWQDLKSTIGSWDARSQGTGGWSVSNQHHYDPVGRVLYYGDGRRSNPGGGQGSSVFNRGIVTVTGGATGPSLGDGGPAVKSQLDDPLEKGPFGNGGISGGINIPYGIAVAPDGPLFLVDENSRIRRIGRDGVITTFAGGGSKEYPVEGGPALEAVLYRPRGIALGPDGSLFIADGSCIRRVNSDGIITIVGGATLPGQQWSLVGFEGDGGPANKAKFEEPSSVAVGPDGTIFIADTRNQRIRRIGPDGIITTIAGSGPAKKPSFGGDGGPAVKARLGNPKFVALAADGSLYVADTGNHVVRRISPTGIITTVAGTPKESGFSGDGGPATQAKLNGPLALALDTGGNLYIADTRNHRIRRVGPDGVITTLAGAQSKNMNTGDYSGDGGAASQAQLSVPAGVIVGPDSAVYVHDASDYISENGQTRSTRIRHRIRRIGPALPGFSGDEIAIPSEDGSELYKFDAAGKHLETRDAVTNVVLYRFSHDAEGRLTKIEDRDGLVTKIERDANGNPTALVAPYGQRTILKLDKDGYIAEVANPAGEATKFTYHNGGLLASLKDPRDHLYRFNYDDMGRLIKDENSGGGFSALARTDSANGFEVSVTTALKPAAKYRVKNLASGDELRVNECCCGAETRVETDPQGQRKTSYPDGMTASSTQEADPRWGMLAPLLKTWIMKTPKGLTATVTADRKAVLTDASNPFSLTKLTDSYTINERTYSRVWDVKNQQITRQTPGGRKSTTKMDAKGRVFKVEGHGLLPVGFDYGAKGRLSKVTWGTGDEARTLAIAYDDKGRIQSLTDPLKRSVRLEYDQAGRVNKQVLPDGRVIAFERDANGNLKSLTPPGRPAHTFAYTPVNLTKDYLPPKEGEGSSGTSYAYDKDKKLTKVTRPDDKIIDLVYDKVGHLKTITIPDGKLAFAFDEKTEKLKTITAPDGGTLSFAYDGSLPTTTTWTGTVKGNVTRGYDNNFRVISRQVNDGPTVAFKHDPDGLLIAAGDLTLERYPESGYLKNTKLGKVTTEQEYNGFGERKRFAAAFDGKDIYAVAYERDALGRIRKLTETIYGRTDVFVYDYDRAGRLEDVNKNGTNIAHYEYDENGNRLAYKGQHGSFTAKYDSQDRILQYGDTTFKHTVNGEWQTKTVNGKTTGYDYDVFSNLRAVSLPDGTKIEYVIDGRNRRIGKKVNGKLVQGFLYQDQLKPIAELDGDGKIVSRFIYGTKVNVPEYMEKGGKTYRIVTDHLGSPRLVIDIANGVVVQRMDYDEFGNVLQDTNPGFQPYGFAGGLYDHRTALVRFGARDYANSEARWLTSDPIRFRAGTNFYTYVQQNPVMYTDPAGLQQRPFPAPTSNQEAGGEILGGIAVGGIGVAKGAGAQILITEGGEEGGLLGFHAILDGAGMASWAVSLSFAGGFMIGEGANYLTGPRYNSWYGEKLADVWPDALNPYAPNPYVDTRVPRGLPPRPEPPPCPWWSFPAPTLPGADVPGPLRTGVG